MKDLLPLVLSALLISPAAAQNRRNVLETLSAALEQDRAYDAAERARLLGAIKLRFADYGVQVVNAQRRPAIPVVLHVITEGSFDEAPPERMAEVAFAAYQAMSRGAPADVVEGIALYGYRKQIPGDTIAAWANGYKQLTDNKVPGPVAADLVHLAMERGLPVSDFDTLKWALVNGVKEGYNAEDYATYLFGHMSEGKSGPGAIAGQAKAVFRKARRERRKPELPAYQGVFTMAAPPPPSYEPPVESAPAAEPPTTAPVPAQPPKHPSRPARPHVPKSAPVVAAPPPMSPDMNTLWPGLDAASKSYLGTPYVWGGVSHNGIDCSGLTSSTYGENRVKIPRVSRDQWKIGAKIEESGLRNGDLVFYNTLGAGVSHVGMVVDAGGRKFIQASSSKGVTVSALDNRYYHTRYLGARRVVP